MNPLWSRIQDTELAKAAVSEIFNNIFDDPASPRDAVLILCYHNLEHIRSMYQHLHDTNEPYDEVLDWQVLFHAIVYDALPEKEYRSALKFCEMRRVYKGCDLSVIEEGRVLSGIMATLDHNQIYLPIVRADLHQLADPVQAFRNFRLIMEESMELYNIDEITFAQNSQKFMLGLLSRVSQPMDKNYIHYDLWQRICRGIDATITFAELITRKP